MAPGGRRYFWNQVFMIPSVATIGGILSNNAFISIRGVFASLNGGRASSSPYFSCNASAVSRAIARSQHAILEHQNSWAKMATDLYIIMNIMFTYTYTHTNIDIYRITHIIINICIHIESYTYIYRNTYTNRYIHTHVSKQQNENQKKQKQQNGYANRYNAKKT